MNKKEIQKLQKNNGRKRNKDKNVNKKKEQEEEEQGQEQGKTKWRTRRTKYLWCEARLFAIWKQNFWAVVLVKEVRACSLSLAPKVPKSRSWYFPPPILNTPPIPSVLPELALLSSCNFSSPSHCKARCNLDDSTCFNSQSEVEIFLQCHHSCYSLCAYEAFRS